MTQIPQYLFANLLTDSSPLASYISLADPDNKRLMSGDIFTYSSCTQLSEDSDLYCPLFMRETPAHPWYLPSCPANGESRPSHPRVSSPGWTGPPIASHRYIAGSSKALRSCGAT